jgi:NAD-dependent SIR2 family protein deacetylase
MGVATARCAGIRIRYNLAFRFDFSLSTNPSEAFHLSTPISDVLTQLSFGLFENKGVFAVLVGSGLSRAAEIPTGWEITLDLVRRVATAQGVEEQPNWAKWYRETTGQEPNYSTLLAELALSPDERRAILHRYIEPTEEDREESRKLPTAAHHAIADLVRGGYIRLVVTTNFDRLIETALRDVGIEPTVVASVDALSGAEPIAHSSCYVLKLHGDYKDARILNIEAELSTYPSEYNQQLDRIFDEYGMIVCGWSGEWDHALRAAFLRAPNRRYPVYWAARGELANGAQELVSQRRARVISIADADGFFTSLLRRVQSLEQSQRQNPLSTDLLVRSAKRYLAKPEFRIQLDELFTQETDRLSQLLDANEFDPGKPWDENDFQARVRKCESVAEPLARMIGVLGRWGDDNELPLALDVIETLCLHAEKLRAGVTIYLNLRCYPAVLVFTAYGLGLTRSERWRTLHRLFSARIARQDEEPTTAVAALFLTAWKGTRENAWKKIAGLEKTRTPLSEHLLALFSEWGKSFGASPDFELMFERFEVLGSLAYLGLTKKDDVRSQLSVPPPHNIAWMPMGRAGWHSQNRDKLVSDIGADPMKATLANAGFAKGDPEFLDLFVENFNRMTFNMGFW